MTTAIVTSKGQITIPASVRKSLRVKAGNCVQVVEVEPCRFEMIASARSVTELKGLFGKSAKAVSINDINSAIAVGAAARRFCAANPRVFGSVLHRNVHQGSDRGNLVDAMPGATIFHLGGLRETSEELLGVSVQVLTLADLPETFRAVAMSEATLV